MLPSDIDRLRKLGRYLDFEQYFPVQIQKPIFIELLQNLLTIRESIVE